MLGAENNLSGVIAAVIGGLHTMQGSEEQHEDAPTQQPAAHATLQTTLETQLKRHTRRAKPTGVVLGSGAYGSVIELTSSGETVAGKVFRITSTPQLQSLATKVCGEVITMLQLSHPNIVQCKGVALLPDQSPLPVLLMERLVTSLHAYLLNLDNSDLPLETKVSFLLDTAKGLDYLHSRTPAIIHRDMTATNVMLTSELTAKITDFGNSRMLDLDPNTTPTTFTTIHGTLEYMPPEAQGVTAQGFNKTFYPSLDVFSFGHLSLFTVTQTQVTLLPPTFTDPETGLVQGLSALKRREQFVTNAEQILTENPDLLQLIKQCLHNLPPKRPLTRKIVETLGRMAARAVISTDGEERERVERDSASRASGETAAVETRPSAVSHTQPSDPNRVTGEDGRLDRVISERELAVIAKDHIANWRSLAPFLGLTVAKEEEVVRSNPGDYGMQKRVCLLTWRQMMGVQATYHAFISAAEEAGNQQLADTVRELCSHTRGTVEIHSHTIEDTEELESLPVPPTETRTLPMAASSSPPVGRGQEEPNRDSKTSGREIPSRQRLMNTLDIDDLYDVKSELEPVTARWKHVGLALRLDPSQLDVIEKQNKYLEDCLIEMLTLWLKRNYNTKRFGEPSWELLAKAVAHRAGGSDTALAEEIQTTWRTTGKVF